MDAEIQRRDAVRTGVRLEVFTVGWMVVEAAVAISAGVVAQLLQRDRRGRTLTGFP